MSLWLLFYDGVDLIKVLLQSIICACNSMIKDFMVHDPSVSFHTHFFLFVWVLSSHFGLCTNSFLVAKLMKF